ncbi:DNA primase [Methyloversatilis sp.]|uniref:DNA primase n=1 Tax=Methyloversatilis sp. TaxID=2569862 RepID=UPI0035ADAF15
MTTETLLNHLDKVRRMGPGRWSACCPAHEDRHASLAVRELDDGRTLLHCFAGCTVHEVVSAAGVSMSDLFPENLARDTHSVKGERRPFPAADVLRCIAFEALVVLTAGASLLAGQPFTDADRAHLVQAVGRIQAALQAGGLSNG